MLSGVKPHNVTFHFHLQRVYIFTRVSVCALGKHFPLTAAAQFFIVRSLTASGALLFTSWWHTPVDREDVGDHLRAAITHTTSTRIYTHAGAQRESTGDHLRAPITSHKYIV